jgi:nucleoside-diphosphate-sugar epimerase
MRVFVAGGTGVIGRRLVPQLVARGHQVTATTTNPGKLRLLERLGAAGKRLVPLIGGGTGYSSWVNIDDAASATVLAVEQEAKGVFNIVDDEPAPVSEWLPYLAECVGAKPPRRIPAWLARPLAGGMVVGMMTEGRAFSNAKAKRELGWELRYPSWRLGFKEELG